MVHRKSEYRLSYKWLPQDICQDVRLSSADYRQQRRIWDFSHHPWGWTLEKCDCEEDGGVDDADRYLPLTFNRRKHQMLVEQWRRSELDRGALPSPFPKEPVRPAVPHFSSRGGPVSPIIMPTPRVAWKEDNTDVPKTMAEPPLYGDWPQGRQNGALHNTTTQTPKSGPQQLRNTEAAPQPLLSPVAGPLPIESSYPQKDLDSRPRNAIPTLPSGARDRRSEEPRFKKLDIAPVVPDIRPSRRRHISSPPRNNPRPSKPPPFHSYGWANVVNSVGGHQIHNVRPKSVGVHPSAHRALRLRDTSLKRSRELNAKQLPLQRSLSATNLAPAVNHSSIWMTEYRRNFSRNMQG